MAIMVTLYISYETIKAMKILMKQHLALPMKYKLLLPQILNISST